MGSIDSLIRKADMQTTDDVFDVSSVARHVEIDEGIWCWWKRCWRKSLLGRILVHKFRYIDRLWWLDDNFPVKATHIKTTNKSTVVKTKTTVFIFKYLCKHLSPGISQVAFQGQTFAVFLVLTWDIGTVPSTDSTGNAFGWSQMSQELPAH